METYAFMKKQGRLISTITVLLLLSNARPALGTSQSNLQSQVAASNSCFSAIDCRHRANSLRREADKLNDQKAKLLDERDRRQKDLARQREEQRRADEEYRRRHPGSGTRPPPLIDAQPDLTPLNEQIGALDRQQREAYQQAAQFENQANMYEANRGASSYPPTPHRTTSSFINCPPRVATYGTPMEAELDVLRKFRDTQLMTNPIGRGFVRFYYFHAPVIARFIANNDTMKMIVRAMLKPMIYTAKNLYS